MYRLTADIFITCTRYLLEYCDSAPSPPLSKSSSSSKLLKTCKALTPRLLIVYKKLSDSYCRGLKVVRHHDPVQSARPRSSPQRMVENTAKGEFLQPSRPLHTVNLLFEDDTNNSRRTTESGHATPCTLSSNLSPSTMYLNVCIGAALYNSKLKPQLTRCPTRCSALESVAPTSH